MDYWTAWGHAFQYLRGRIGHRHHRRILLDAIERLECLAMAQAAIGGGAVDVDHPPRAVEVGPGGAGNRVPIEPHPHWLPGRYAEFLQVVGMEPEAVLEPQLREPLHNQAHVDP